MTSDQQQTAAPHLRPPGSGIPRIQVFVARRIILPFEMWKTPWDAIPGVMIDQAKALDELVARACGSDDERLRRRVLIPPTIGLEDDSRFWSAAMVFDHLRRVNERMVEIVRSLATDRSLPDGPSQIVDFKPDPAAARLALHDYRTGVDRLIDAIRAVPLARHNATGTVSHPWFGPLRLRQWVAFTPMHQRIHTKQLQRIARALDANGRSTLE